MPTNKILPNQLQAMKAQTQLDHICALEINSESSFIRQSGIVCTIGPVTRDVQMLEKMIETGMNIARLNFSHGSHEYHAETIKNIRAAQAIYSKKIGTQYPLAIALDTKGPEVRTGSIEGGPSAEVQLKQGNKITLTTDKSYLEKGNATFVYINCNNIHKMVSVGTQIFIDDNTIELTVSNIQGDNVICTIMNGGMLGGKKGVKLVGVRLNLPPVSEDDRKDILFGVEHEVDMIFHSFVGSKAVVDEIRNVLGEKGKDIYVVAKIENLEGKNSNNLWPIRKK